MTSTLGSCSLRSAALALIVSTGLLLTACTPADGQHPDATDPPTTSSASADPDLPVMTAGVGDQKLLAVPGLDFPENTAWVSPLGQEIQFSEDNRVVATVGCNSLNYHVGWNIEFDTLALLSTASTQEGCGDADAPEGRYVAFLGAVDEMTWDESSLTLTTRDGESISFTPFTPTSTSSG